MISSHDEDASVSFILPGTFPFKDEGPAQAQEVKNSQVSGTGVGWGVPLAVNQRMGLFSGDVSWRRSSRLVQRLEKLNHPLDMDGGETWKISVCDRPLSQGTVLRLSP